MNISFDHYLARYGFVSLGNNKYKHYQYKTLLTVSDKYIITDNNYNDHEYQTLEELEIYLEEKWNNGTIK